MPYRVIFAPEAEATPFTDFLSPVNSAIVFGY